MTSVYVRLAIAVALLALSFISGYAVRDKSAEAEIAKLNAVHAAEKTKRAEQHAEDIERVRTEERNTQRKIQEALDAENAKRTAAEAARRKSDAAAVGLRNQLQATRTELADLQADPSTSERCQAAAATGAVCTDLLGQCSERRRELAAFAESSARAGDLCVRTYQALTP